MKGDYSKPFVMKDTVALVLTFMVIVCAGGQRLSLKQRLNAVENKIHGLELRFVTENALTMDTLATFDDTVGAMNISLVRLEDSFKLLENSGTKQTHGMQSRDSEGSPENCKQTLEFALSGLREEKKWLRNQMLGLENKFDGQVNYAEDKLLNIHTEIQFHEAEVNETLRKVKETVKNYEEQYLRKVREIETHFNNYKTKILSNCEENTTILMNKFQSDINKKDEIISNQNSEIQNLRNNIKNLNDKVQVLSESLNTENLVKILTQCPESWKSFGHFCYFYDDNAPLPYKSAREKCSTYGAHVADIESEAELAYIGEMVGGFRNSFWVGIKWTYENGDEVWMSDRTNQPAVTIEKLWKNMERVHYWRNDCVLSYVKKEPYSARITTEFIKTPCHRLFHVVCKKPKPFFEGL